MNALSAAGLWPGLALVGLGLWLAHAGWAPGIHQGRRPSQLALRVQDWLAQADLVGVRVRTIVLVCVGGALGGAALGLVLGGWLLGGPVAGIVGAVLGFGTYPWWLRGRHARHREQVRRALPEAIERVRDALGSGLTIDRAFDLVAREGPEVLQPVMTDFCAALAHLPFEVALTDLQQRLADRDFDLVASGLLLHNEVGGRQFRASLDQLATSLRELLAIRDRLDAGRARIVLSARLVAVSPVGLLLLLRLWSPATAAALARPTGQIALLIGAVLLAVAYLVMLWLARLPSEERVLVR